MSVCRECGQPVVWAKRENGRTHPPLTHVEPDWDISAGGLLLAVIDGVVYPVHGQLYVQHACLPEDKIAWKKKVEAGETRDPEQEALRVELQERHDLFWKLAAPRPCPKCGAEPGDGCKNLSDRRYGKPERDTVLPHEARMPGGKYPQMWNDEQD